MKIRKYVYRGICIAAVLLGAVALIIAANCVVAKVQSRKKSATAA